MRSLSKILIAATAALVASGAVAAPASAATAMRFSVRPDPDGSLSPGADYFVLEAEPGDTVTQALQVSNPGARPVRVRLAPVDATTAQFGGVDYTASGLRPRVVGAWIELEDENLELAPGEVETVPFTVSVPAGAPTGVNLGGIAAWTPPPAAAASDQEGLAATTEVHTRRVVAVQVELPGPAEPVLEIAGVSASARPDGVYLQIDLHNSGNGFAQGEGTLELPDEEFAGTFALDKVVPGTGVAYPLRWRKQAPPKGSYPVVVEIDYGAGVAEYEGEVVIGGGLEADLADRGIRDVGSGGFPAVPAAAAGAALLCCAVALLVWRRRRRPAPASAAPTAPVTAVPPPSPSMARPHGPPPPPPPVGAGRR
jgi:hypothetical protein